MLLINSKGNTNLIYLKNTTDSFYLKKVLLQSLLRLNNPDVKSLYHESDIIYIMTAPGLYVLFSYSYDYSKVMK